MSILELLQHIVNEPAPGLPGGCGEEAREFVRWCLVKGPEGRPSPKELLVSVSFLGSGMGLIDGQRHPWMDQARKEDVSAKLLMSSPRHAEIAQLDLARGIEEDVGRLDVPVYDPVRVVEVGQALEDGEGDLGDDWGRDCAGFLVDLVERPRRERLAANSGRSFHAPLVHVFHHDADVRVGDVGAVEGDDVSGAAVVHDLEFAEDLFPHRRFRINEHQLSLGQLSSSHSIGVKHTFFATVFPVGTCTTLVTVPPIPLPELTHRPQILGPHLLPPLLHLQPRQRLREGRLEVAPGVRGGHGRGGGGEDFAL